MIVRRITVRELVGQIDITGRATSCALCDNTAEYIIEDDGPQPICSAHRLLTITTAECYYHSHQAHLERRGVDYFESTYRAIKLLKYVEVRCLRANS